MKSHIYTFDIVLTFTEKRKTNNHRLPFTLLVFLHYKNQKRPTFVSGQQVTIWLHIFLNFAQENLNTRPKKFLHPLLSMDVIRLQTSVAKLFIQHCLQVGLGRIGQKKGNQILQL